MNTGLTVDETLPAPIRRALEEILAAIQQGWLKEHDLEGLHLGPVSRPIVPAEFSADTGYTSLVVGTAQPNATFLTRVQGGMLWMQVYVQGCTVSSTPAELRVRIPDGWYARDTAILEMGWANEGGTLRPMIVSVVAGHQYVSLTLTSGAWANASGTTAFGFTGEFRVRR